MAKVTIVLRDAPDGKLVMEFRSRPPVKQGVPLTAAQDATVRFIGVVRAANIALHRAVTEVINASGPGTAIGARGAVEPTMD